MTAIERRLKSLEVEQATEVKDEESKYGEAVVAQHCKELQQGVRTLKAESFNQPKSPTKNLCRSEGIARTSRLEWNSCCLCGLRRSKESSGKVGSFESKRA